MSFDVVVSHSPLNITKAQGTATWRNRMTTEAVLPKHELEQVFADAGALARALELATEKFPGFATDPVTRSLLLGDVKHVRGLANQLAVDGRLQARVRRLSAEQLDSVLDVGATVLAVVDSGWLVALSPGKGILVSALGERRVALSESSLRELCGRSSIQGLLLEPRFALQGLAGPYLNGTSVWSRLRALIRLERREVMSLTACAVVVGALSLAVPLAVQVLINTIAFGSLMQPLLVMAVLLFGVLALSGSVQVAHFYGVEIMQRRIFVRVAEDLTRRFQGAHFELHDREDPQALAMRFFEAMELQKSTGLLLLDGLTLCLQTVVGLVLLAFYHPLLLAFDVVLVGWLALIFWLGHGAVQAAKQESSAKYRVVGWLRSCASRPSLFKHECAAIFAATRTDHYARAYLVARKSHYKHVFRQIVAGAGAQGFSVVALLAVGGGLVISGELTLGQLVAAELVVGAVGASFLKLGKHIETSYDLLASLDKLGHVLDLPQDSQNPPARVSYGPMAFILKRVNFPHSSFGPKGEGVSAMISARERVYLNGEGSCGKSSLLEVMAGLRAPSGGAVHIDNERGAPDHIQRQLRSRAFLLRSGDIVAGSILDNLQLADSSLDHIGAWSVLRAAALYDVVMNLPERLQTEIWPGCAALSSCEMARLCLARAWIARPDLLLVDGALDDLGLPRAEYETVLDSVLGPMSPFTVVVATNSRLVQQRCDAEITL